MAQAAETPAAIFVRLFIFMSPFDPAMQDKNSDLL
jgi:hypothetical protein